MFTRWRLPLAAAALMLVVAACGTTSSDEGSGGHDHHQSHPGNGIEVTSLEVTADAVSGWNVHFETRGFEFAPQHASADHVQGEGHAHIYVDDVKLGRVYGNWHHLSGSFAPGTHVVKISLNGNDHAPYAGAEATAEIEVEGEPEAGEPDRIIEIRTNDDTFVPGEVHEVMANSAVRLIVHTDAAGTIHLHGYDIMAMAHPGDPAVIDFVADVPGVFELEVEETGLVVALIEVS